MRRLPVYILLDTSGSMRGEPIEALNLGLQAMVSALRQDPHALESVHISVITFDLQAKLVVPLTPIDELQVPTIQTPQSGPTCLGDALVLLEDRVELELKRSTAEQKGDWAPMLFVMTDGSPSDTLLYTEMCERIRQIGFASTIGCVAGPKARVEDLRALCTQIVTLDTMDSASFGSLFQWVSSAISTGNQSMGATNAKQLPPPPPEIPLVI